MTSYLQRNAKPNLAYHYTEPASADKPTLVFCGGYRSDMEGTKAIFLEEKCKQSGLGYLRFDYSGHGQSNGEFEELVLSDWINDTLYIIDQLINGPILIIGSSMGGWIGMRTILEIAKKSNVKGFVGIAAAPDFTEDLFELRLNKEQQQKLLTEGIAYIPNDYSDEPYSFTKRFYEDGKTNLILRRQHEAPCPMYLIQGREDKDVPWQTTTKIQQAFSLPAENIIIIEDGDHRLSKPDELETLWNTLQKLV